MDKMTVEDLGLADLKGHRILMRVDFNVPLNNACEVSDDSRIQAALPTISKLIDAGVILILISHLGRPKGLPKREFSLEPVYRKLNELCKAKVYFGRDCVGQEASRAVARASEGEIVLLENLRFHPEEEMNEPGFSEQLASLSEIYVNDAFGTAHRAHASTVGVTEYLSPAVAGLLMKKELEFLGKVLENPVRPFVVILGGAKISGKIDVIENLLPKLDSLIIAGGMSGTFFKSMGFDIGDSIVEDDKIDLARKTLKRADELQKEIQLPLDCVVADKFSVDANKKLSTVAKIEAGWQSLDIGPQTISKFKKTIEKAKTIVWNGPLGVFEIEPFAEGTIEIARAVCDATKKGATSIIGGGDTVAAIFRAGLSDRFSHISTGGGATLEFLAGKTLPGVEALTDR